MNIKCPNCGGSMIFDTTAQKIVCEYCKTQFDADYLSSAFSDAEYMEMNIFSCSSCGAELAMTEYETSSYCIYCGQPTIAFNRISNELKPKYIIPFKISKQQAISNIRNSLTKGFFVPRKIKNFKEEYVRGIYIPYWLFDMDCSCSLTISDTQLLYEIANTHFSGIPVDASLRINDEVSQRLEPYYTADIQPFHPSYLSGFYSDCYDVSVEDAEELAKDRATKIFLDEIKSNLKKQKIEHYKAHPNCNITARSYIMMPAWFLTFNYKNEPYTFLVNGQTGKVVGSVPYIRSKMIAVTITLGLLLSIPSIFIFNDFLSSSDDAFEMIFYIIIAIGFLILFGYFGFQSIKTTIGFSKSRTMFNFVKNRQGELK